MAETSAENRPAVASRLEHIFPTLTPEQVARIEAHGSVRPIRRGEVLVEEGAPVVPFFVVKKGQIEVVRPARSGGGRSFGVDGCSNSNQDQPVNLGSGGLRRPDCARGHRRWPDTALHCE